MKATQWLHELGQSLWLDSITRGLLTKGTLHHYITEFSVTGLTSNPTIFDHAIRNAEFYDEAILEKVREGKSGEELFFELTLLASPLDRPILCWYSSDLDRLFRYRRTWPSTIPGR